MQRETATNTRKVYGICLVKNEDDVIAETLAHASGYCEQIFVLDNGSTDDTWRIVKNLAAQNTAIVPFGQVLQPFDNGLRAMVYNALHRERSDDDWWLILDADEFLAEDPNPVIESAVQEQADFIKTWQIQFYFTEKDLHSWEQGTDCRELPIIDRRHHYLINWQEIRLFRNDRHLPWNVSVSKSQPEWLRRVCTRRILNRHYQYRDPVQMEKRLCLRYGQSLFPHVRSSDWRLAIRDSRTLNYHRIGARWRFSPSGVLYYYRRSLAWSVRSKCQAVTRRLRALLASNSDQRHAE